MVRGPMYCAVLLSALACCPAGASGPGRPSDGEPPAGVREPERTPRPFIERSLVLAPERVGDFTLLSASDYPGQPQSGVGLRYRHADLPEVRLDLFVYPAGRVARDRALADAMTEVRASIEHARDQGKYSALAFGEETGFDLRRVDAADGSLRVDGGAGEGRDEPADLAIRLAAAAEGRSGIGRRLGIRMTFDGKSENSLAFVFYRGLFLYKGRVSVSPKYVAEENFERVAQLAMAQLVPAIKVRSTGGCAATTVTVDPGGDEALALSLAAALADVAEEECADTLDESVPEGQKGLLLTFDPAMWRSPG